jgi:hypothetical protein
MSSGQLDQPRATSLRDLSPLPTACPSPGISRPTGLKRNVNGLSQALELTLNAALTVAMGLNRPGTDHGPSASRPRTEIELCLRSLPPADAKPHAQGVRQRLRPQPAWQPTTADRRRGADWLGFAHTPAPRTTARPARSRAAAMGLARAGRCLRGNLTNPGQPRSETSLRCQRHAQAPGSAAPQG